MEQLLPKFHARFGYYEPDEYKDWLDHVGFKANLVESSPADMIFSGKEAVKAFIRATWVPVTARIPEDLLQDFIEELANTYISRHPTDSAGLVHIPLRRLEVDATKV